jgi:SAM-dependent methyltransferase
MKKEEYLLQNKIVINNKHVLDLACHDGESTKLIQSLGANHIYAVDIRQHLIEKAKRKIQGNVDFFVHDITDYNFLKNLVEKSQTVVCLGVFYHLFDHFRFLSKILQPNIDYVLIETVCGPETINPEMFWGFEPTDRDINGWLEGVSIIPNGTPNLSWIVQSANIFGFELDWIHYYGASELKDRNNITIEEYTAIAGPDWPAYSEIISDIEIPEFVEKELEQMLKEFPRPHRRMILRLYNKQTVDSKPLDIQDHYRWPY